MKRLKKHDSVHYFDTKKHTSVKMSPHNRIHHKDKARARRISDPHTLCIDHVGEQHYECALALEYIFRFHFLRGNECPNM